MGIFSYLRRRFGGGQSKFQGDKAAALKKYKLDAKKQNINFVDIKTGYARGILGDATFFQHISSLDPATVTEDGLDPALRDEVNFNSFNGKTEAFQSASLGGSTYRFIFAFPCDGRNDTRFSKALENLGWLQAPANGGNKYLYIFSQGAGTEYFSANGVLNRSSEVMFPHRIDPGMIEAIYTLTWKGSAKKPTVTRQASMQMGTHRAS